MCAHIMINRSLFS